MKKIYAVFISLLIITAALAQSPQKMSYQAVIRNAAEQLVANQVISMKISILRDSATGNSVYTETHSAETNINGLVTLEIGNGTPLLGTFAGIDWSQGTFFIKTETDPSGGTEYSISGVSQLLSVPYALHAKTAENIAGGFNHYIGELFGGGIIVAVWKESGTEHGLIASLSDLSYSMEWSNITDVPVGEAAQSPRDGQANTRAIIAQSGHLYSAAQLCDDYSSGGFTDWYLPAAWELNQCFNAVFVVNTILGDIYGFKFDVYWGSTEDPYNPNNGWIKIFYDGKAGSAEKGATTRVRAVRRF